MKQHYYMHTIAGKPAYFAGDQIVYADVRTTQTWRLRPLRLATSLRQIRREQRATIRVRRALNFSVNPAEYGYALVDLP